MMLFAFPAFKHIARELRQLPGIQEGKFTVRRFPNQELNITFNTPVVGEHCLIVGSITPPDKQLLSFLLLSDTLKRHGAHKVTAILPYIAYSRQDKLKEHESMATAWLGNALASSGVDEVIAIDVHSSVTKSWPIPVTSLDTTELFANVIRQKELARAIIVAPDKGALEKSRKLATATNREVICLSKTRTPQGVTHADLAKKVSKKVIVLDDMLDTGSTLISCCKMLRSHGAKEITIMVTHGLFTGEAWKKLWSLGVRRIYCTDTIPSQKEVRNFKKVVPLSTISLLINYFRKL